jgi:hypothetical protein
MNFKEVLNRKIEHYGNTEAAYEFAAEEYARIIISQSSKQYDIHTNGAKLNEFPIEAENEEQLEAFLEIGMSYDLGSIEISQAKVIRPSDIEFKKTSKNTFNAYSEGSLLYTAYIEKGKVSYIDLEDVWDNITKTPLKKFKLMPNFNLEF